MAEKRINWVKLKDFCEKLLIKQGLPLEDANLIAMSLVEADLNGVSSHGVSRMKIYMKRIEEGVVRKSSYITIEKEYPGALVVNAHNSMGIVARVRAIDMAIEKAKAAGSVFVTVKHSNHFGSAAFFTKRAVKYGMIAFAASNAPPTMAPWGACQAYLGTNPLSVAIPTGDDKPIILDMATSVVAQGKIIMAAKNNEKIPEGWAITKDGKPTTDPKEALEGTVLPFGGVKGYGIALLIEILSGILSGSDFGPYLHNLWKDFKTPQNLGHVFHVIDVSKYIEIEEFYKKISILKNDIKNLKKADGVSEIYLPGEVEMIKSEHAKVKGIVLSEAVLEDLRELANKWDVKFNII